MRSPCHNNTVIRTITIGTTCQAFSWNKISASLALFQVSLCEIWRLTGGLLSKWEDQWMTGKEAAWRNLHRVTFSRGKDAEAKMYLECISSLLCTQGLGWCEMLSLISPPGSFGNHSVTLVLRISTEGLCERTHRLITCFLICTRHIDFCMFSNVNLLLMWTVHIVMVSVSKDIFQCVKTHMQIFKKCPSHTCSSSNVLLQEADNSMDHCLKFPCWLAHLVVCYLSHSLGHKGQKV